MIKDWIEQGKFGNVYHVYCSFRSFRSIPGLGGAFTTKEQSGGGVLIDWGVHFFDIILYVLLGLAAIFLAFFIYKILKKSKEISKAQKETEEIYITYYE